jgi:hypothetical protein
MHSKPLDYWRMLPVRHNHPHRLLAPPDNYLS